MCKSFEDVSKIHDSRLQDIFKMFSTFEADIKKFIDLAYLRAQSIELLKLGFCPCIPSSLRQSH